MVKKIILCVDGGGIKGIIVSQFLKRLEQNLPCSLYNTFDMFAGTSTGAIIIASISYRQFTASKIVDELYTHENSSKIMNKSLIDKIMGNVQTKPKYDGKGLKEVLSKYIPEDQRIKDTIKPTIISSFNVDSNKPMFFKSFGSNCESKVDDALQMSSAAPSFFPSYYDEQSKVWGVDGGIFCNDPSDCAYANSLNIFDEKDDIRVLSIGTGYAKVQDRGEKTCEYGGINWVLEGDLIDMIYSGPQDAVEYRMKVFTKALNHKYLRINGVIENTSMDDTSEDNIIKLKQIGNDWWNKFREETIKFVTD